MSLLCLLYMLYKCEALRLRFVMESCLANASINQSKHQKEQQKVESPTSNRPSPGSVDRLLATAPPLLGISLPTPFQGPKVYSLVGTRTLNHPLQSSRQTGTRRCLRKHTPRPTNGKVKMLGCADGSSL
ncbi:hypothetical protein F5Y02DRAFT_226436 [Annulohypoxylon stygium]|nr:hypothetical protein F5Y02DRAFT_226436 [Annulohypoxylon stygium]